MPTDLDIARHARRLKAMPGTETRLYNQLWNLVDALPDHEQQILELWTAAINYGVEAEQLQRAHDTQFKGLLDVQGQRLGKQQGVR